MKSQTAEFSLGELIGVAIILVVVGLVSAYCLQILGDVKGDFTAGTSEYNATESAVKGVAVIPNKLPLIAGVVVAVVIIGLLLRYLVGRQN